jgi:hypothetical protein
MIKVLAISSLLVATAALAQPAGDRGPNNDPNQIVCVKEGEIGSRLSMRRVCRTRAEWAEHKAQNRRVTEKVQNESKQTMCMPPTPC